MRLTELFNGHADDKDDGGHHYHVDHNLQELLFRGSQCTRDCSGHKAGYAWSELRGGVLNPWSPSPSFVKGSNIAYHLDSKRRRRQSGGKITGVTSQTAAAIRKRERRLAKRNALVSMPPVVPVPPQTTP
jgi:hypothetical protein